MFICYVNLNVNFSPFAANLNNSWMHLSRLYSDIFQQMECVIQQLMFSLFYTTNYCWYQFIQVPLLWKIDFSFFHFSATCVQNHHGSTTCMVSSCEFSRVLQFSKNKLIFSYLWDENTCLEQLWIFMSKFKKTTQNQN